MKLEKKRLFFGFEVMATWPSHYPKARLIDFHCRHLTLAFLGNVDYSRLQDLLPDFPTPPFKVGSVGYFDRCLLLPEKHPHVVAWHVNFNRKEVFNEYQDKVVRWLTANDYVVDDRPFLPHVTIGRDPINASEWLHSFIPLPVMIKGLHLYESVGNLNYLPIWSCHVEAPFIELEHTADLAFLIQAESIPDLQIHAQMALAFKFPTLLQFIKKIPIQDNLEDIVIGLNQLITMADINGGCPLKAVSFHGEIEEENGIFKWRMIVDV